jgi:hypothetical protein
MWAKPLWKPILFIENVIGLAKLGIVSGPIASGYQYIGPNTLVDTCGEIA